MEEFAKNGLNRHTSVPDASQKILSTLEQSNFAWLSAEHLAEKMMLPVDIVQIGLTNLLAKGRVIRAVAKENGREYFTTWQHYKTHENIWNRLLNSISGSFQV